MRKINFISFVTDAFQSSRVLAFLLFLFTTISFTAILASSYYMQDIVANGISKKDIIAKKSFEVVDVKKTDFYRQDAANKIKPILVAIESNYIKQNLNLLVENISKIKNSNIPYDEKRAQLNNLLHISNSSLKKGTIDFILNNQEATLKEFFKDSMVILEKILQSGLLTETEFAKNDIESLFYIYPQTNIKRSYIKPIMSLMEHVIVPNLLVDESATNLIREKAKDSIKPFVVTFKRGDYILKSGEPVTQFKKDALKKAGYTALELNKGSICGLFSLVCLTFVFVLIYMKKYEKNFYNLRYLLLQSSLLLVSTVIAVTIAHYDLLPLLYLIFPAYTLILAIFTSPVLACLSLILTLCLFSVALNFDQQLILALIFTTILASYSVSKINYTKRFDLIKCGFEVSAIALVANLLILVFEWDLDATVFNSLLQVGLAAFTSSIIALGSLPFIEKLFKIVTPYGLIELADHNQELLATLQYKAPGTYHHSLMVANLCEGAAEAIGGNPILARVGAYYHDIGKLERPLFFIENQSYFDIENPHIQLNPRLSKMVITSHAKDGVKLAKEHGLPQSIINFIQQHHGESLAGHFYQQAIQQEGKEAVSEEQFRYPGPKPNTKETAILMLADAVESAVRSLKNPSPDEIEKMISKIITERLNDGQLSDSPLTLKDIKLIASTFNRILRGMQHDRIKYQENLMNEFKENDSIRFTKTQEEKNERKIQRKRLENESDEN
ncbi:MAG: HDIG domain-containing protein [Cyanobacteria bacterium SIG30]|nr:HDIG domain-containing protein [Cyanobacteria bacterium SIG30]